MDTQKEQVQSEEAVAPEGITFYNKMDDIPTDTELQLEAQPEPEVEPEIDPEIVEVDGSEIPLSEVDNPKSYKFFQSKFTSTQQELQKEREARIRLEERMNMQTQVKPVQEELKPPVKPQRPANYRELQLEALQEPHGRAAQELARYEDENDLYIDQKLEWEIKKVTKQYEPIVDHYKTEQQEEAERQQQLNTINEVTNLIGDPIKADAIVKAVFDPEFFKKKENLEAMYAVVSGKVNPVVDKKTLEYMRRNERSGSALPPGASLPQTTGTKSFGEQQLNLSKTLRI